MSDPHCGQLYCILNLVKSSESLLRLIVTLVVGSFEFRWESQYFDLDFKVIRIRGDALFRYIKEKPSLVKLCFPSFCSPPDKNFVMPTATSLQVICKLDCGIIGRVTADLILPSTFVQKHEDPSPKILFAQTFEKRKVQSKLSATPVVENANALMSVTSSSSTIYLTVKYNFNAVGSASSEGGDLAHSSVLSGHIILSSDSKKSIGADVCCIFYCIFCTVFTFSKLFQRLILPIMVTTMKILVMEITNLASRPTAATMTMKLKGRKQRKRTPTSSSTPFIAPIRSGRKRRSTIWRMWSTRTPIITYTRSILTRAPIVLPL
jgi:hypothetical protein